MFCKVFVLRIVKYTYSHLSLLEPVEVPMVAPLELLDKVVGQGAGLRVEEVLEVLGHRVGHLAAADTLLAGGALVDGGVGGRASGRHLDALFAENVVTGEQEEGELLLSKQFVAPAAVDPQLDRLRLIKSSTAGWRLMCTRPQLGHPTNVGFLI